MILGALLVLGQFYHGNAWDDSYLNTKAMTKTCKSESHFSNSVFLGFFGKETRLPFQMPTLLEMSSSGYFPQSSLDLKACLSGKMPQIQRRESFLTKTHKQLL